MWFCGQSTGRQARVNNADRGNDLSLSDAHVGKSYTMLGLTGGNKFREKIYSMGLNPGVKFRILINSGHGPIELVARQTKLAIGRGMAYRIKIKENGSP